MEPVLLDMALKGAVVLALTGAVAALARSASAAARHLVWSIGLAATAALPLLRWLLPDWDLAILPGPASASVSGSVPAAASAAPVAPGQADGLVWLWLAGTAATLGAFLAGRARVRWIARHATPLDHGLWAALLIRLSGEIGLSRRVRLLQARGSTMPMMWGILRPTILLPREADHWSPALQRDVMLHELAHVQRHDYLTQMVARMACALHWFDPLAWLAARRMRLERERACDDRVIDDGSSPCEYAEHLLAVARWRSTGVRAGALGMAGRSPLGDRLRAILETGRDRRRVTLGAALGQTAAAALLVVPLATLHPEPVSRAPDARDPGGVLPVPPSASAGLREAEDSKLQEPESSARVAPRSIAGPAASAVAQPAPRAVVKTVSPAVVAPVVQPGRRSVAPRAIRIKLDRIRPLVAPVFHATVTPLGASARIEVRVEARARVEARTEICAESEKRESRDENPPVVPSRTTLASVPQQVVTP
jgi:beta-lactamase regulating signal transducer with metallopeptidase domain